MKVKKFKKKDLRVIKDLIRRRDDEIEHLIELIQLNEKNVKKYTEEKLQLILEYNVQIKTVEDYLINDALIKSNF